MNQLIIIGNLVKDPEARSTPEGKNNCAFRVAVNDKRADNTYTTYFDVTAWERLGESCYTYLKKGSKVLCIGRASSKPYIGKDGKAYGHVMLTASQVEFLTPVEKKDDIKAAATKAMESDIKDMNPDDIPF